MNKPLASPLIADCPDTAAAAAPPPLTAEEVLALRRILSVVKVDAASDTLRIETGKARILLRPDGTVRIEGRHLTQMVQGTIVLNAAAIELN